MRFDWKYRRRMKRTEEEDTQYDMDEDKDGNRYVNRKGGQFRQK